MNTGIASTARRWAAALGLAAAVTLPTLTSPVAAAPMVPLASASVPVAESNVVNVRERWGNRNWRRGGWGRDHGWNRHRYYRHRHHRDRGVGLALGIGIPLAAYLATRPAYGYYDDGYYGERYVVRRAGPRHFYGGNRHVRWCYNRYRSYRAYDNTFQPYHGPRQQCYSPFS